MTHTIRLHTLCGCTRDIASPERPDPRWRVPYVASREERSFGSTIWHFRERE